MKHLANIFIIVLLLGYTSTRAAEPVNLLERARITKSFDLDWRFLRADAAGSKSSEGESELVEDFAQVNFDDSSWRRLNVPHDWSIEGPFDQNNPTGRGGGYIPSGIGWYRKHFTLPADYCQRRVFIDFDGVMAHSDVWINGFHLGKRPFGYVSFRYELTGYLNFGKNKTNVIAVRADNSAQPASRWYSGAGIYRHVRLVITDPVHIDQWGVFVTTPKITPEKAVVHVQTTVINQSDIQRKVTLQTTILTSDGQAVESDEATQFISGGKSVDFQQDITVRNPQLWDLDNPNLYRALSKLRVAGANVDDEITTFGIREFKFEAATGFWLNGKNMKIKGVCLHHDGGAMGAAVPKRVWERRLELLKRIGANGIRTSHNPVAPEFLDLCDRLGFVVLSEVLDTWTVGKRHADYGYHRVFKHWWRADTRDTVLRDRNHPSIILYSAGNEIRDNLNSEQGFETFIAMRDLFHRYDPTRPVTMAVSRPNQKRVYDNGFAELMDVVGQNYREHELIAAHRAKPERKVIGTENNHGRLVWLVLRDNPFMAGQFLWTGIDYLGEADWPNITWGRAPIDRTGMLRPMGYERQSWWAEEPMVHIARYESASSGASSDAWDSEIVSNWTPRDYDTYDEARVNVYSNCEQVELVLNGNSLGSKLRSSNDSPRTWRFPFEIGTIKALGKNEGKVVAIHELRTAGKPAKILLASDRTKLMYNWDDVSHVTVTIVDENDIPCPWAEDLILFKLSRPGVIAAVDNGDIASHESFQASERRAYRGRCLAIIRATAPSGWITLTASAAGLTESSVTIEAVASSTGLK